MFMGLVYCTVWLNCNCLLNQLCGSFDSLRECSQQCKQFLPLKKTVVVTENHSRLRNIQACLALIFFLFFKEFTVCCLPESDVTFLFIINQSLLLLYLLNHAREIRELTWNIILKGCLNMAIVP